MFILDYNCIMETNYDDDDDDDDDRPFVCRPVGVSPR